MQWLSKKIESEKNLVAWLGALTLLFSYAELFIPRIVPFFRLGLANVAVLMGLSLSPLSFAMLLFIKAFCSSMMGGTLFTPFFFISLMQSVISGFVMYVLFHVDGLFASGKKEETTANSNRYVSFFGISVAGAGASAVVQIELCRIYLGQGTLVLLGPMLLFSVLSGIVTAAIKYALPLPPTAPVLEQLPLSAASVKTSSKILLWAKLLSLIFAVIIIFTLDSWKILLPVMIVCLVLQRLSGRKIKFLPYIVLWVFIIITSLFEPQGKIIFALWKIKITYGALMSGITKVMIMTSVSALSQCVAGLKFYNEKSLISQVFLNYQKMIEKWKNSKGNFLEKLQIF